MNFNFIFSGEADHWVQWQQIYSLLPYLLFYAVDICETLMALIAKKTPTDLAELSFHRSIGLLLWAHDSGRYGEGLGAVPTGLETIVLDCPRCKRSIQGNESAMCELFSARKLRCPHCRRAVKLPDFVKSA
jgi:hypothetical protein